MGGFTRCLLRHSGSMHAVPVPGRPFTAGSSGSLEKTMLPGLRTLLGTVETAVRGIAGVALTRTNGRTNAIGEGLRGSGMWVSRSPMTGVYTICWGTFLNGVGICTPLTSQAFGPTRLEPPLVPKGSAGVVGGTSMRWPAVQPSALGVIQPRGTLRLVSGLPWFPQDRCCRPAYGMENGVMSAFLGVLSCPGASRS